MVMMDRGGVVLGSLSSGAAVFDAIEFALNGMGTDACSELAWDLVDGKGERDLVARAAHELRRLRIPVRREWLRVDLVVADTMKVEFKVCHAGSVFGSLYQQTAWGLGVFDKHLTHDKGDLYKLLNHQADLLVAAVPVLLDTPHAKYGLSRKVGPDELDGLAASKVGDLTLACEAWASGHGISFARRSQHQLADEQIGRVQLNLFGFVRSDDAA